MVLLLVVGDAVVLVVGVAEQVCGCKQLRPLLI
jgi:hypothetical protein